MRLETSVRKSLRLKAHVSHQAYGFRKVDTYITAIWHGCGDLPLP